MSKRDELAEIIETVAREGLPEPRDMDVAIDAILCALGLGDDGELVGSGDRAYD